MTPRIHIAWDEGAMAAAFLHTFGFSPEPPRTQKTLCGKRAMTRNIYSIAFRPPNTVTCAECRRILAEQIIRGKVFELGTVQTSTLVKALFESAPWIYTHEEAEQLVREAFNAKS